MPVIAPIFNLHHGVSAPWTSDFYNQLSTQHLHTDVLYGFKCTVQNWTCNIFPSYLKLNLTLPITSLSTLYIMNHGKAIFFFSKALFSLPLSLSLSLPPSLSLFLSDPSMFGFTFLPFLLLSPLGPNFHSLWHGFLIAHGLFNLSPLLFPPKCSQCSSWRSLFKLISMISLVSSSKSDLSHSEESQCPKHGQLGPTCSAHLVVSLTIHPNALLFFFSLHFSVTSASSTHHVSYHLWDFVFVVPSALNILPPVASWLNFLHRINTEALSRFDLSGHLLHTSNNSCPPSYFILFSLIFFDSSIVFCVGFPLDYESVNNLYCSLTHSLSPRTAPLTCSTYSTNA